jgi:nucleotide-binding universal stress UspA family protein
MFQKILVATDISQVSNSVFDRGLSQAEQNKARLLLLHVLSTEEDDSPLPILPEITDIYPAVGNDRTLEVWREQWDAFVQKGLDILQQRAKIAKDKGIETEYRQIPGNAGKIICKVAREWEADLIVIGRRGRSGLGEIILGSISNYVLHRACCSVLIIQ